MKNTSDRTSKYRADSLSPNPGASLTGFLGATALGILAFKGFTTITNSPGKAGGKNLSRIPGHTHEQNRRDEPDN